MTTEALQVITLHQLAGLNRWYWRCHACSTRSTDGTQLRTERARDAHRHTTKHERNARRLFGRRFD